MLGQPLPSERLSRFSSSLSWANIRPDDQIESAKNPAKGVEGRPLERESSEPRIPDSYLSKRDPSVERFPSLDGPVEEYVRSSKKQKAAEETKVEESEGLLPELDKTPFVEIDVDKPPYSNIMLIIMAIRSAPNERLTLTQIYEWIENRFGFYRNQTQIGWQNNIRHSLTSGKFFSRQKRPKDDPGKGPYWVIRWERDLQRLRLAGAGLDTRDLPMHDDDPVFEDVAPDTGRHAGEEDLQDSEAVSECSYWNDHVEIWAANERIGHVEKSYDVEVGLYPDGFKYDCALIKPQNASFIQDVKSPIADMGWLSRDSWSSLRQQTSTVKILGRTESHRNAKSVKCHLCSDVLIVGEGIFLNQTMAAGKPLKDHSRSTWESLVSRAVLYRVSPDFDPPTGYSGIALTRPAPTNAPDAKQSTKLDMQRYSVPCIEKHCIRFLNFVRKFSWDANALACGGTKCTWKREQL
ncbi:hypothetical protein E8E13_002760 [Curvularia kusanoi]|uniref:Fork-head domain-containing protein n=1 Tax=Curvularia kusanoi TaxID=90978 RepID=A0A9P4WAG4_CURKU|nr:hypothetical protein E8E13_002760 [Curvularia kusanoi]